MKANKFFAIALASITLALSACSKDKSEVVSPNASFYVVETTFDQAYTAGVGRILVSEEGFNMSTDADWLQAQKEGAKAIVLTIAKNETAESRTANVIISKGDNVQRVPITQLGAVNTMTLSDINTQRQGGEYTFSTERMDTTPTVTVSDSWISYTLEGNELKIKVEPFAQGVTEDRVGTVTVQAGLFSRTIRVTQIYGVLAYADLVGRYNVEYFIEHGNNGPVRGTGVVSLEAKEANKSFTLKGLAVDVTLHFDPATSNLTLKSEQLSGIPNLGANQAVYLSGWGALTPKENGEKDSGLSWGGDTGLRGIWNKDFENISFKFDTFGFGSTPRPVLAFFLGEQGSNGVAWKSWYTGSAGSIFVMGDATWTKIK